MTSRPDKNDRRSLAASLPGNQAPLPTINDPLIMPLPSRLIFGFHSVLAKLRHDPGAVHEIYVETRRSRTSPSPISHAAGGPLTLVPAVRVPRAAASTPSLSLHSPQGWRLEFAPLPPAGWLTALWGERA